MEPPSIDHPTPYPGKTKPRTSVRASIKGQEIKSLAGTNVVKAFTPQRQKHGLSVGNTLDLPANDKPLRSSRRLSVPSKYATSISNTEVKEIPLALSDSNSTFSKPFILSRASALKTEKSLDVEANLKSSKKEVSVSFEDSSIRSQTKANVSNKDAPLTPAVSINSMVTVTSAHPKHGQRRKPNILMSSSYWLDQIKLSESAGKHAISLGFFRLALESAAEPLQRLCDELKEYALRNNVLEFGEVAKDVLQSYGVLEEIMSADINGHQVELSTSGEESLSKYRGFITPMHEMSSVITDNGEDGFTGGTAKNIMGECHSTSEIVGSSTASGFNVTDSFCGESEVFDLKMDKIVALEDYNVEDSVCNKSSGGDMEFKTQALLKDYVMEGKAIGNAYVQQSITNQKSCAENGNLNVTDKTGLVASTKISGTLLNKKNAIRKDTRSITMPGIMSKSHARKSSKVNSAEKVDALKTLRSTARCSCTLITNTKKESCVGKNTRQDDKKGTTSNDISPLDLPFSIDNGKEENRDNQPSQRMDLLNHCKDIKGFPSEYIEKPEGIPINSTSADTGFDILKMSVDTLMDEVVSLIMLSMDDCMDSSNPVQGSTVKPLEDNIRDTIECNSREKIMSPSTLSMPGVNNHCGIVHDAHSDNIGSDIRRIDIAAGHDNKEMHEDLDGIPTSKDNGKEIVTVQLDRAENDRIEVSNRLEPSKSEINVTKSKFLVSKAATGKEGHKRDVQNKTVRNSNKENIMGKCYKVPSIQSGSIDSFDKEVKVLEKSNEGHCQNPGNGTPGSIRRSTRLSERASS